MRTENLQPINYFLEVESGFLHLNQLLGKTIRVEHSGSQCLNCGLSKPIFRQGHCQSCFFDSPATGDWIMRPELSKAHLGQEDRDLEYESNMQLQPHTVYLALSSHLKVGVTRKSQLPTRWIDQGAHQATVILEVPNRYLAGVGEVALKNFFSDKTNWRKMLQNNAEAVDWEKARNLAIDSIPNDLKSYVVRETTEIQSLTFPVLQYPEKVKSLNLSKTPLYQGKLMGIKGQYLIFEDATVFNVRSNEGQCVRLSIN
ncbi:DUF2797 domain-containing protein [Flavobacteriaceae bacterium]|nr:DUF2797 domain-containing protein [Flavobacteriaceae bacterium]